MGRQSDDLEQFVGDEIERNRLLASNFTALASKAVVEVGEASSGTRTGATSSSSCNKFATVS